MTQDNKTQEKINYNEGLTVKITAKIVDAVNVANALAECPEFIIFTKNVKKFDMLAFKGVDCKRFDFSTAINLERIGTKCFKNAKNIQWCGVLERAEQMENSFENAEIIGREQTNTI